MPGYDGKVMQLRMPKEHWSAVEDMSRLKRGREINPSAPEQMQNFRAYLRWAMHQLAQHQPSDVVMLVAGTEVCKTNNNFPIPEEDLPRLEQMAARFGISVPRLCNILIIHPLLKEHYDINGF